jgi:hypothetical protein
MTLLKPKRYKVDLQLPPQQRWDELLSDKWAVKAARNLVADANKEYGILKLPLNKLTNAVFNFVGTGSLGYDEEIAELSPYVGDADEIVCANLTYEIYQLGLTLKSFLGLCTSVAFDLKGVGMIHARNMDWPIMRIRKSTILVDFKGGAAGAFTAVTVPGLVGVLSGVAKGRFSATINSAEDNSKNRGFNFRGWSAMFLLRYVFESCKTYDEAVAFLKKTPTIALCFIQLVGCKKGQACVIEMGGRGRNRVHEYEGVPLGISNNYRGHPDADGDCQARLDAIEVAAAKCGGKTAKAALAVLRRDPVNNESTVQSMVLVAKTGAVYLQDCWS